MIGAVGEVVGNVIMKHTYKSEDLQLIDFSIPKPPMSIGLVQLHAILMLIAWSIVLPFGIFFARFAKGLPNELWIKVHLINQIVGYLVAFSGFAVALAMVTGGHFKTRWHAQLGVSLIAFTLLQIFMGIFRPPPPTADNPSRSTERLGFEIIHAWFGRLLIFAAIINTFGGMVLASVHPGLIFLYSFVVVVVGLVCYVILELKKRHDIREKMAEWADNHCPDPLGKMIGDCIEPPIVPKT